MCSLDWGRFFGKTATWFWQMCFYSAVLLWLLESPDEILDYTESELKLTLVYLAV